MLLWLSKTAGDVVGLFERLKHAQPQTDQLGALLIVPRGLAPDFYFFCDVFAKQRRATLVVDRRVDERRRLPRDVPLDRRREHDRRGHPPSTWIEGSFVLVRNPTGVPSHTEPRRSDLA